MKHTELLTNLSTEGKNWLTLALDPFHDYNVPVAGYPDGINANTAVQLVKKQVTITRPTGLDPTASFDVMIAGLPINTTIDGRFSRFIGGIRRLNFDNDDDVTAEIGTVMIIVVPTGENLFPGRAQFYNPTGPDQYQALGFSGTDDNSASPSRVIFGGVEVHNVTETLSKSGTVTCGSFDQAISENGTLLSSTLGIPTWTDLPANTTTMRAPPQTLEQAISVTNSRQWEASKGLLMPFRFDLSQGNTVGMNKNTFPKIMASDSASVQYIASATPETINGHVFPVAGQSWRPAHLNTSYAMFTGLSPETKLTVDMRFGLEVVPNFDNVALVSMASPAAESDVMAEQAYVKSICCLPPGVPVSLNAKGDWWRMSLKALDTVAPTITGALGIPELTGAVQKGLKFAEKNSQARADKRVVTSSNPRTTPKIKR